MSVQNVGQLERDILRMASKSLYSMGEYVDWSSVATVVSQGAILYLLLLFIN